MIVEGDQVTVTFPGAENSRPLIGVVVTHIPQATGESWVFVNVLTREEYYVSCGCVVTKKGSV